MSKVDNKLIEETRAILLKGGHGRYDVLTSIFASSELETDKPIVLVKKITVRLGVGKEEVNYFSFYSWLKAWRQKKKQGKISTPSEYPAPVSSFQFTDPSSLPSKETTIIKIV